MVESIQIPKGYKQTEVGVIPEDWEVSTIVQKASINTGSRNTQDRANDGIYPFFVRSQDVERINSYSFDGEAVLTAGDGVGTGKVFHYIVGKFDYHQRVYKISDFTNSLNGFYFYLYFQTHFYNRIISMTAKSSVDSVRMDMISKMPIPVPPISEQKAIVQALFDIGKLIEKLEKFIAKKRDIKLAAMQQLLTGKVRLPGFTGNWGKKRLGDILTVCHGKSQNGVCVPGGKYPILASGGEIGRSDTAIYSKSSVLIGRKGTIDNPQYVSSPFWTVDTLFYTEISDAYLPKFIYFKFCMISWRNYNEASGVPSLNARTIENIRISVPDKEEQIAIVSVLSDMDSEITSLEKRLTKTKAIQQGMMQELLTGRIRLIKSEPKQEAKSIASQDKKHNWAIDEAIIVSTLVNKFGTEQFPLGRKRYTKMSYLFHRYTDRGAEGYLKMAAGPYNPKTKYGGAETIARKNGYIKDHKSGPLTGFICADNIQQALDYFNKWYGEDALHWLEQFRYEKNDVLELWATVDMAVHDLFKAQRDITVENVKSVIRNNKEWKPKLKREIFSDENIAEAISKTQQLFAEGQT